jgi:hypothetical protein
MCDKNIGAKTSSSFVHASSVTDTTGSFTSSTLIETEGFPWRSCYACIQCLACKVYIGCLIYRIYCACGQQETLTDDTLTRALDDTLTRTRMTHSLVHSTHYGECEQETLTDDTLTRALAMG